VAQERGFMPRYKNSFKFPDFREETIIDENGYIIGTIRIKPSTVLWKPRGEHNFFAMPIEKFAAWITDSGTAASRTGH
jgi:hypothetical protein